MKLVRVAAAVINQTPLDWQGNRARILAAIAEARRRGVSILCLPELCITGYGCEDAFHGTGLQQTALEVLAEIVPSTRGMVVSLGLPLAFYDGLFNCAALVVDGRVAGFVAKKFLAGEGLHYEPRWFRPWPQGYHTEVEVAGLGGDDGRYPLGDVIFDIGGIRIGFEICEDAWVANRPGGALALQGADVILNPSASHFAFGKHEVRQRFVLEGSRAFGVTYVYANLVGNEAGRTIYDGGALIASCGKLLAAGPRFGFAEHQLTAATIDVDLSRMSHGRTGSFTPNVQRDVAEPVRVPFAYPEMEPEFARASLGGFETSAHLKEEEFTRAVALGLHDYLRKSRAQGFVVSLSGGADSTAVATLVAQMVALGVGELGLDGFVDRFPWARRLRGAANAREVVGRLLTTAYQATENSGPVTREAARVVAAALGAEHFELDVDPLFKGYVAAVEVGLGRRLAWETDDLALQNIQARVRAPGIWLLANLRGALLLNTSNRSEAAVGYATMDGDTAGGLSPVGGIDKAFLRRWLRWMEEHGPLGLGPLPELAVVTRQQPTAELRPPAAGQTDEADLMPYELLDAIERAAIRDRQTPLEVFRAMRARFRELDGQPLATPQLAAWIERFFRLWCQNQWKRERYAPSFHVDDENLDPKTWCRFPILSGGFERELEELRKYLERSVEPAVPGATPGSRPA
jgi:NAD+ synthase (glutamine-hydrolysing)